MQRPGEQAMEIDMKMRRLARFKAHKRAQNP